MQVRRGALERMLEGWCARSLPQTPQECFLSPFGAEYRSGYEEAAGGGKAGLQAGQEVLVEGW